MKRNNIVAIIQARTGSNRLPGKVLKKINDKPILEVLINRVKQSKQLDAIVVATTEKKEDDNIVEVAKKLGVGWYRGSEDDVLKRFVDASRVAGADIVVRITADNPLTDPESMDELIEAHLENQADYTHCTGAPLGLISVEVVNKDILDKINSSATSPVYREHVTFYIKDNPHLFKIYEHKAGEFGLNRADLRLTVDTQEDLELMRELYYNLGDLERLKAKEVIEFLDAHPEIRKINAHIEQIIPAGAPITWDDV